MPPPPERLARGLPRAAAEAAERLRREVVAAHARWGAGLTLEGVRVLIDTHKAALVRDAPGASALRARLDELGDEVAEYHSVDLEPLLARTDDDARAGAIQTPSTIRVSQPCSSAQIASPRAL